MLLSTHSHSYRGIGRSSNGSDVVILDLAVCVSVFTAIVFLFFRVT